MDWSDKKLKNLLSGMTPQKKSVKSKAHFIFCRQCQYSSRHPRGGCEHCKTLEKSFKYYSKNIILNEEIEVISKDNTGLFTKIKSKK